MSNFREMTVREAMPFISTLYESFGVKSMILLKDSEWINLVSVIHFTRRKVEDLNDEYRFLEKRLGKIDHDNFKIILQAKPISEFCRVVKELEDGYLSLGDLRTRLLVREPRKTLDEMIHGASDVVRSGEYVEYDCYSAMLSMDDTSDRILSKSGISASTLGLRDFNDLARSWLGVESLTSSINVHIIIPIYAAAIEIQYQGGNEIKATLKMDQRLSENSTIWLTSQAQDDAAPIRERIKHDVTSCDNVTQNGFVYTSLTHKFSALALNDRISVSLLHDELGLLRRKEISVFRPHPSEPFSQTFALFDAGKNMEEHLLDPRNDEDLVASVSWLFEMIGIWSLKLGRDETVRENKTEKGSADIIAYDPESKEMLLVDCTIAVPSEPKIDKIRSTADYISRKIGSPIKAVIVTAKKSTAAKQLARRCYVKLIDNTDLERMIGFYKKGHSYPARGMLRGNI